MIGLDLRDREIVRALIGAELAARDDEAIASAIADLRAELPAFRREAARLLAEEVRR
ncbi:hypothetical protein [Microbacterium panaciterrae]|uniref:Uncharacterized protein n=1 Tax=Microbacterium panaciterrae TaxID=985759 RepID=A0ABP8P1Z1_9MICO